MHIVNQNDRTTIGGHLAAAVTASGQQYAAGHMMPLKNAAAVDSGTAGRKGRPTSPSNRSQFEGTFCGDGSADGDLMGTGDTGCFD